MNKMTAWLQGWLVTKGSDLSGNYGHKGRKGKRGGSLPGGGHMALGIAAGTPANEIRDKIGQHRAQRAAKKKAPSVPVGHAPTDYDFDPWISMNDRRDKGAIDYLSKGFDQSYKAFWGSDSFFGWARGRSDLLAKEAGLDSQKVLEQVAQWSSTSNDTNIRALSMQAAVAQEFDVPLSKWQMSHMQEAIAKFPKLPSWQQRDQRAVLQPKELKHLARTMYDRTQKDLAAAGYKPGDTIRLYRGVKGASHTKKGEVVDLEQNAASSWSAEAGTAWSFAYSGNKTGRILAMDVPVESILSTAKTGMGALGEAEFVVLGIPGAQALVIEEA